MRPPKVLIQKIVLSDGKHIAVAKSVAITGNNESTISQVVVRTSSHSSSSSLKSSSASSLE